MSDVATLMVQDKVATITINRPSSMNGYNLEMAQTLLAHTEAVELMTDVKVILIKGAGPCFMAGGDVHFFKQNLASMPAGVREIIRMLANTILNIQHSKKIYLAQVHGAVAGAGMSLMLAADLVIAEENTVFSTAYNGLGTSPDGGLSYFLPRLVGSKRAIAWLLLSERLSAQLLFDHGLINQLASETEMATELQKLLMKLIGLPRQSSAAIKRLVKCSQHQSLEQQLEEEAQLFISSVQTAEFKEGVNAFLEKRQAKHD